MLKKLIRVCVIILFFTIFHINTVKAIDFNFRNFTYIDISIDGQVFIDSQVNGISKDFFKGVVDFSDISIIVEENGEQKTYTDIDSKILNKKDIKEYSIEVDSFSKNAYITINARLISKDFNLDMYFSKKYSVNELNMNTYDISNKICSINISSNEVKNIITHDVIFEIEEGGKFLNSDSEQYIEHINILSGDKFPDIPEVISEEGYKFLGWYNEKNGEKIEEFPERVDEDLVAIGKFEFLWNSQKDDNVYINNKETNLKINNNDNLQSTMKTEHRTKLSEIANVITTVNNIASDEIYEDENLNSYNPPKSSIENNIVLLIVSYILSLTVSM